MGEIIVVEDTPQQVVWSQPPDAMPTGVDVLATQGTGSQTVADDFLWESCVLADGWNDDATWSTTTMARIGPTCIIRSPTPSTH